MSRDGETSSNDRIVKCDESREMHVGIGTATSVLQGAWCKMRFESLPRAS
jgi:hypothetical protein